MLNSSIVLYRIVPAAHYIGGYKLSAVRLYKCTVLKY